MKPPSQMSRTAILVEGALMMALAFGLSMLPHFDLPFGGSVSWFATGPIIIMSLRHGLRWGVGTAAAYSVLQAMQGMNSILLCKTIPAMLLCALLDYLLAYTIIGFTGPMARRFKNPTLGIVAGVLATGAGRFLCSFVSGMVLWYEYAGDMAVWKYSLSYNASWCVPDVLLALVATLALSRVPALGLLQQKPPAGAAAKA